jgi:hypothetical protein
MKQNAFNEIPMIRKLILIFLLSFIVSGCVWLGHSQQLLTLKRASDSGEAITQNLTLQETLFEKLKHDIALKHLETGVSRKYIVDTYGEPILTKQSNNPKDSLILLYRHPTQFFASDRIYLYFDQSNTLTHWEHKS